MRGMRRKLRDRFLDDDAAPLGRGKGLLVRQAAQIVRVNGAGEEKSVSKARAGDQEIEGSQGGTLETEKEDPKRTGENESGQRGPQGDPAVKPEQASERQREADGKERRAVRGHPARV